MQNCDITNFLDKTAYNFAKILPKIAFFTPTLLARWYVFTPLGEPVSTIVKLVMGIFYKTLKWFQKYAVLEIFENYKRSKQNNTVSLIPY